MEEEKRKKASGSTTTDFVPLSVTFPSHFSVYPSFLNLRTHKDQQPNKWRRKERDGSSVDRLSSSSNWVITAVMARVGTKQLVFQTEPTSFFTTFDISLKNWQRWA
jgi:hypothetical protein